MVYGQYGFGQYDLTSLILMLDDYGVIEAILPFVLIFVLTFALLQKVKIFGSGNSSKKFNLVISTSISLLVVLMHYGVSNYSYLPANFVDPVAVINATLPSISATIGAIFLLMLVIGMGTKGKHDSNVISRIASLFAVGFILYIVFNAVFAGDLGIMSFLSNNPGVLMLVMTIVVIAAIVGMVYGEKGGASDKGFLEKLFDGVSSSVPSVTDKKGP